LSPARAPDLTGKDVPVVEVTWPNEAAPGLAPFRLEVPDGWTAAETSGALLVLLGPERDGFRPNVVVLGDRLGPDASVDDVADQTLTRGEGSSVGEGTSRPVSETRLAVAVRRGNTRVDGRVINQLVVATEAGDRSPAGLRSVYSLVASFLADHLEDDEPVLKAIIESFTVRSD
jgi:hypothetical protein